MSGFSIPYYLAPNAPVPDSAPADGPTTQISNGRVFVKQAKYDVLGNIIGYTWVDAGPEYHDPASSGGKSSPTDYMNADTAAKRNIIDDYIARQNAISEANKTASTDYTTSSGIGRDLLTNLISLAKDPAAGPLGLSAYAQYGGGAQNIVAGTGGAGIANPHAALLDTILNSLTKNALTAQAPNPSATTAPIDPNKAPALTPEQAAKSPNEAPANFGFSSPDEAMKMHDYFVAKGMIPAAARGGKIPLALPPVAVPPGGGSSFVHDVMGLAAAKYKAAGGDEKTFWNTIKNATPASTPISSIPTGETATPLADQAVKSMVPGFEDGGLQMLAAAGLDTPEKVQQALAASQGGSGGGGGGGAPASTTVAPPGTGGDEFEKAINQYGQTDLARRAMMLASHGLEGYGSGAVGDGGKAIGGYQIRTDAHPDISAADAADPWKSTEYMSNDYNLGAERVMRENPDLFKQDPARAAALAAFYAEKPTNMYDPNLYEDLYRKLFPQMAGGGGMTIGGEPHFIIDAQGRKVAALTEDGKNERVDGIGGVEVTPLDPKRKAAYEARKMADGGVAFATGGSALFPNIPGSGVNESPTGTNSLPSAGGPSVDRATQIGGGYFKPAFQGDLPADATSDSSATRTKGFAELLGGALAAGNTAVPPEFLQSLRAGKAPQQLLSANTLQTLAPTQRTQYFALLQAMGLGTPEDNLEMIKQGRPDTMGSFSGSGGGLLGALR